MKIGTKLIIGFTLVVLLTITLAFYSVLTTWKSLEESVATSSMILSEETLKKINRGIFHRAEDLQIHSRHLLMHQVLTESNRAFEKMDNISAYLEQNEKEWISAAKSEITPFMRGLLYSDLSERLRTALIGFYENEYGYKVFDEVFLTNKYGAIIAFSQMTNDYRCDDEKWWQSAKKDEFYLTNPEYDRHTGKNAISLGVRIDDNDGNFIGILKAVLDIKTIIREAEVATKKYDTTRIMLITDGKKLIYRSNEFVFYEDMSKKEYLNKMEGKRGFYTAAEGGKKKLFTYVSLKGYKGFEGPNWILVMTHDLDEILKPAILLRNRIIFASVFLILLAIIIAYLISRSITKPLIKLAKGAKIIGDGNLNHKVEIASRDETGYLGQAFNEMLDKRKKAEENIRKLSEVVKQSPMYILITDLQGNIEYVNPAVLKITGYTQEEIIGKNPRILQSGETPLEVYKKLWDTILSGEVWKGEFKNKKKDGSLFWEIATISPSKNDNGIITHFVAIKEDITEKKKAEEELIKRTEDLQATFQALPDLFFRLDEEHNIINYHAGKRSDLYENPEDFINRNMLDILPAEVSDKYKQAFQKVRTTGSDQTVEYALHLGGTERFFEGRILLRGKDIIIVIRNITDRRNTEAELQKIQRLESLGLLAGGIAHDFNNILAGIITNIYIVRKYLPEDSKGLSVIETTQKAIIRAKDLTQQLLTFSRGGVPIAKTTSIDRIINESTEFVLAGSNVICKYRIADDLWPSEVDEGQISQVIQNLLINSRDAMPKGGTIQISMDNIERVTDAELPLKEGHYIKIVIQDKGPGISKEHINKIFDPFFTTKEVGGGLGLSVAYSIVKNHNGHISVRSEMGSGAAFTIYLPASEKPIEDKGSGDETDLMGHGKILFMDDEGIIRDSIGQLLELSGYEVEHAEDGKQAIALYKKEMETKRPFDAVILDLTIRGGMGGKETIKKLLEIDPGVKAIVTSGYSNDPVMANFREYGFIDVLVKPFNNPKELILVLRNILTAK